MITSALWYYGNFGFLLYLSLIFLGFYSDYVTPRKERIEKTTCKLTYLTMKAL